MDQTALERQNRRIERLKTRGVERTTVLVHKECRPAFEELRPHLANPDKSLDLASLILKIQERKKPTNVSQVKQLSPFRYPGGKTWLIPEIRQWLLTFKNKPSFFIEPFAGGAMAGLTIAAENLASKVILSEIDSDVSAVWKIIFQGTEEEISWLQQQIVEFSVTRENVLSIINTQPSSTKEQAFRTIIKNRMQRGGIMAPGAGLVKDGESGKGLLSRWYPETLSTRIELIQEIRNSIEFQQDDAFKVIERFSTDSGAVFFIDPPYTAGGKKAGARLYTHNEIDHDGLFLAISKVKGAAMLTYDDAPEVVALAQKYDFRVQPIPMKNTHHKVIKELLIIKQ